MAKAFLAPSDRAPAGSNGVNQTSGRRMLVLIRSSPSATVGQVLVKVGFAAYALILLAVIEYGLLRRPLGDISRRLGVHLATGKPTSTVASMPWVELHCSAARAWRVLAWWPFPDTCLRRCLLLGALMRDYGPELSVGVRRDESGAVVAHSWLLIAGQSIDPTSPRFDPFTLA